MNTSEVEAGGCREHRGDEEDGLKARVKIEKSGATLFTFYLIYDHEPVG